MDLRLGATIKRLRIEKGATQEELAKFAGVSFQAVSKWETDTTLPDIALLPRLALFFGVCIDDLFAIGVEDEMRRIDHILESEQLTDDRFAYAKRTLDAVLRDNEQDVAALKRYARLYDKRNSRDRLAGARILERAMELSPQDEEIFSLYQLTLGGDRWSVRSANDDFIRICEPYAGRYPGNLKLRQALIEAMIDMRYFDRARVWIGRLDEGDPESACFTNLFKGDIELAEGKLERAKALWSAVDSKSQKGQYEAGERFNSICDYEKAIVCYENAFMNAAPPRDLSAVYALAFLYTKLGQNEKAIEMWRRIIDVLDSDWNQTDGETVAWPQREIEKLKAKG